MLKIKKKSKYIKQFKRNKCIKVNKILINKKKIIKLIKF